MKPTLLLLAAGMGSPLWWLKAARRIRTKRRNHHGLLYIRCDKSRFWEIVFIIRKDFEAQFREKVLSKYEGHIPAELVFQSVVHCQKAYGARRKRKTMGNQPRCTYAKPVVHEPFCVINCDDFYNRDAFYGDWEVFLPTFLKAQKTSMQW